MQVFLVRTGKTSIRNAFKMFQPNLYSFEEIQRNFISDGFQTFSELVHILKEFFEKYMLYFFEQDPQYDVAQGMIDYLDSWEETHQAEVEKIRQEYGEIEVEEKFEKLEIADEWLDSFKRIYDIRDKLEKGQPMAVLEDVISRGNGAYTINLTKQEKTRKNKTKKQK